VVDAAEQGRACPGRRGDHAIRGVSLSVDPALAFHALRYYHANPDARAELDTDAAVRRVRAGAVLTT